MFLIGQLRCAAGECFRLLRWNEFSIQTRRDSLSTLGEKLWYKTFKLMVLRHEPVLPGGTEIAHAGHLNARAAAIAAGVLAIGAAFR
jgi:hypothetical protein